MKQIYTILFFLTLFTQLQAQVPCPSVPQSAPCDSCCYTCVRDYYWVGNNGSGDFEDPSNWNLDSLNGPEACRPPFTRDNVYFMAGAFTVAGAVVQINGSTPATCHDMYWDVNIRPTQNVTFQSSNSENFLNIYGSLSLANKDSMNFNYRAHINFRSTDKLATIQTGANALNLRRLQLEGSDTTEFRLQDDLLLRNQGGSLGGYNYIYGHGGFLVLRNGLFNTNGYDVDVPHFQSFYESDSTTNCRGLNISGSRFTTAGYRHAWSIDFDTTAPANFCSFDATGSHIVINQIYPYNNHPDFGRGLHYDSLTNNAPHAGWYMYNVEVNHMFLYGSTSFPATNLLIRNLTLQGGQVYIGGNSKLTVETLQVAGGCGNLATINNFDSIRKETTGLLTFENTILKNIDFDPSGGRSYIANNSLDNGEVTNCTINGGLGRDLYFIDSGDRDWHNIYNWYRDSMGIKVRVYCIPTVFDNVYFDDESFPNAQKFIFANASAQCHDMRWLSTVADSAYFQLGTNYSYYAFLDIYGTLELTANMRFQAFKSGGTHPSTHYMRFYGRKDSIIAQGRYLDVVRLYIDGDSQADYTIIDDLYSNHLMSFGTVRSQGNTLFFTAAELRKRYLDSVQVYLYGVNFNAYYYDFLDRGAFDADSSYTGTTTFHLVKKAFPAGCHVRSGGNYPNVIAHVPLLVYNDNREYIIHGDFTLLDNAELPPRLQVLGDQKAYNGANPYEGNMVLTAGKNYTFKNFASPNVYVQNKFLAKGDCISQIIIQHEAAGVVPMDFNDPSLVEVEYVYMAGLNNISGTTINATNSVDALNNSNWNFTVSPGVTFYWRADLTAPLDYDGLWSDPNHWTTNVANAVGDGACIPGPRDTVIFDNQSFSLTSNGCTIDDNAFCKTVICTDAIHLKSLVTGGGKWYVNESMHLHNSMTMDYSGELYFVGSGVVQSDNVSLQARHVYFQNATGNWDLLDDFTLKNDYSANYGILQLVSGTLNTNDFDITLDNRFVATGTQARTLNLGASTIEILDEGGYYSAANPGQWVWDIRDPSNMTLNAGTSTIICRFNSTRSGLYQRRFYMGDGLEYNNLHIYPPELCQLHGNTTYNYLVMYGSVELHGNNTCDSLYVEGSRSYNFAGGSTQTLKSPYGKIVSNGSLSNYINFQSFPTGQKAYFHKEYGTAFCVDFLKVQDNEATKGVAPALTVWDTLHQFLAFQTGVNSDNIGGTATGIWEFNLPPLKIPTAGGDTTINLCTSGNSSFPIELTGTSPYLISGTWSDAGGGSGTITDTILYDNDGNQNTPLGYTIDLASNNTSVTYVLNITTYRCGEERVANPVSIQVNRPAPSPLVQVQRNSACYLDNQDEWRTFVDDVDERPILSMNDFRGAGDNDSLKNVMVSVDFDATTQYWGSYPYLQRNWTITPENKTGAKVRLYFTQEELDSLHASTASPTPLVPATDIVVIKFASGIVTVGPGVIVPHTVVSWNPTTAAPLSTTTDIIGVEYEVDSFSAFIIIPTHIALLANQFIAFDAQVNTAQEIALSWTVDNDQESRLFVVERSTDAVNFETIAIVEAYQNGSKSNNYQYLDKNPYTGSNYYRIGRKTTKGNLYWSTVEVVALEGITIFEVYPNPVVNQGFSIKLQTEQQRNWSISILDQLGRELKQQHFSSNLTIQTHQIDLGSLPSGVYILRMTDDSGQQLLRKFYVN